MKHLLISIISMFSFTLTTYAQEDVHQDPTHNFDVHRLIIIKDNSHMLMTREETVWAPPSFVNDKRQYVIEALDSLAQAYGINITNPQLRGQFSFKYDYHPHATLRHYYVANYQCGNLEIPEFDDEAKWMPIDKAIEISSVTAIKQITEHIMEHPDAVWGGSFMVSRTAVDHPTAMIEKFYPLFQNQ